MNEVMEVSHTPSMNLRFVERTIERREGIDMHIRKVRVLQQMMVPKDWNKHDEFWKDVPCFDVADVEPNAGGKPRE